MGLPAYYGVITATILGYLVSFIICFVALHFKYKINYESSVKNFVNILCGTMVMMIVLLICKLFIPVGSSSRIINLFIILIYTIIGGATYLGFMHYLGTIKEVFGNKVYSFLKKDR